MIPRHKIFHTVLFLLIFLKFIGSSFTESVNYEHIKKSFTVNKSLGYSDKESSLKSFCVPNNYFDDLISKCIYEKNYLNISLPDILRKILIQISSRFLL
jgi:hypothetical protein